MTAGLVNLAPHFVVNLLQGSFGEQTTADPRLIRCNDHRKSTGAQLRNCIEAARQSVPLARRFDEVGRIRVNDPVAIQYDQPGVLGIDVSVTVLGLLGPGGDSADCGKS